LLHLPWLDAAKSYRGVFLELTAQLPANHGCVAAPADEKDPAKLTEWTKMHLRESERGLLHTVAGIKAVEATTPEQIACEWVLVEVSRGRPTDSVGLGPDWQRVWEGRRPADRRDSFMLFRRIQGAESDAPTVQAESPSGLAAEPKPEFQTEPEDQQESGGQPGPEAQPEPQVQPEEAQRHCCRLIDAPILAKIP